MRNQKFILIPLLLTFISCSTNKPYSKIQGSYNIITNGTAFENATVKLKKDGTFRLRWEMYYTEGETSGVFSTNVDTMILNSNTPDYNTLYIDTNEVRVNNGLLISRSDINYKAVYLSDKIEICYLTTAYALINKDTITFIYNDGKKLFSPYKFIKK